MARMRVERFKRRYLRKAVYTYERFLLPLPLAVGRTFRSEDHEVHEWLGGIVAFPRSLFPSWTEAKKFLQSQLDQSRVALSD